MQKNNITFLFGAGAEAGFDLPEGADFAKSLLFQEKDRAMNEAITEYYNTRLSTAELENRDWYSSYQTPRSYDIDKLLDESFRKKWLNQEHHTGNQKEFDKIIEEQKNGFLATLTAENENEEKQAFIEKNPSYIHLLDRYFHTIIEPRVYGSNNFWKVITLYTRAYLVIVSSILYPKQTKQLTKKQYLDILNDPKQTLDHIYGQTVVLKEEKDASYYHTLAKWKEKINIQMITTNYTPFAEVLVGADPKDIAYVHGKIGWFECPFDLQVYNFNDTKEREKAKNKLVFPYLFIQSGIKPVIEYKQVNEYSKMNQFLLDNTLIVIGYGLNIDDNHINSILQHFLIQKDKTMYYFYFDGDGRYTIPELKQQLLHKLRLPNDATVNLEIIPINAYNWHQKLEELLAKLSQDTVEKATIQ